MTILALLDIQKDTFKRLRYCSLDDANYSYDRSITISRNGKSIVVWFCGIKWHVFSKELYYPKTFESTVETAIYVDKELSK